MKQLVDWPVLSDSGAPNVCTKLARRYGALLSQWSGKATQVDFPLHPEALPWDFTHTQGLTDLQPCCQCRSRVILLLLATNAWGGS